MRKVDILDIAIKIFGIYLFAILITSISEMISAISFLTVFNDNELTSESTKNVVIIIAIIKFITILAAAIFFTFGSKTITRRILDSKELERNDLILINNKKDFLETALIIVGLLIIVLSLPEFLTRMFIYSQPINNEYSKFMDKPIIIAFIARIATGIIIIYFNKNLAKLFLRDNVKHKEDEAE
jgi:hypothetical protein